MSIRDFLPSRGVIMLGGLVLVPGFLYFVRFGYGILRSLRRGIKSRRRNSRGIQDVGGGIIVSD